MIPTKSSISTRLGKRQMIEQENRSDKVRSWRKPEPLTDRERRNEHRAVGQWPEDDGEDFDHEIREIHEKGTDWAGGGRIDLRQGTRKAQVEPRNRYAD